jgi:glutathione peroxidase
MDEKERLARPRRRLRYGMIALALGLAGAAAKDTAAGGKKLMSVYDFTLQSIDGKEVSLSAYAGKAVLMVNVASKCGFTPQYEGLERLYETYKERGLVILGFPANNFGSQEPGSDAEIKEFCTTKFHVSFPMFSKISVKGADQHPLYRYLTSKDTDPQFGGEIGWNFTKFLIDRNGAIAGRFDSKVTPESKEIREAVEKVLSAGGGKP